MGKKSSRTFLEPPTKKTWRACGRCDADLVVSHRRIVELNIELLVNIIPPTNRKHGYPRAAIERHPPCPANQHHQPARKLLLQILHVPCHELAATQLCRRRCVSPVSIKPRSSVLIYHGLLIPFLFFYLPGFPPAKDTLRPAQDCRLRSRKDGGGAQRWSSARSHHFAQCDAHT